MGWKPPKPDVDGCGSDPSALTDIYLKQLGDQGLFGYETVDPGQGRARSQYAYLVLDNDYAPSEYGYADPAIPASVTLAHEYNHVLQMTYDTFQDVWFLEATATWSEEQVYPDVNDWLGYVNAFAEVPQRADHRALPAGRRPGAADLRLRDLEPLARHRRRRLRGRRDPPRVGAVRQHQARRLRARGLRQGDRAERRTRDSAASSCPSRRRPPSGAPGPASCPTTPPIRT